MLKRFLTLLILSAACVSTQLQAQERFLVGGTNSDKLAIICRQSGELEWQYSGVGKEVLKTNSVVYTAEGNVAFATPSGAKCITREGEVLFEYRVQEGEELQSLSATRRGGYLLGITGKPIRIVELDKRGEVTKELCYNSEVENIRHQFRQIAQTKSGGYLIPLGAKKCIVELDKKGAAIKSIALDHSSLYVSTTRKGDWLATTGHAGVLYSIDAKSGSVSQILSGKELSNGARIEFGAEVVELRNGNLLLANWVGHNGDQQQPILIELDRNTGEVVWQMARPEGYTFAAAVAPIY